MYHVPRSRRGLPSSTAEMCIEPYGQLNWDTLRRTYMLVIEEPLNLRNYD